MVQKISAQQQYFMRAPRAALQHIVHSLCTVLRYRLRSRRSIITPSKLWTVDPHDSGAKLQHLLRTLELERKQVHKVTLHLTSNSEDYN
eukprot:6208303-Amphidinium_carterae.1